MKSDAARAPFIACLGAAALFGASTPASKLALGPLEPLVLAGLLYLGAALAVLPFSRRGGSPQARRRPQSLRRMAGVALFGGILGPALMLWGLRLAPAASVSLWLNLETVGTALLGWLFFKEHMDGRTWLSVGLVTTSSVALAAPEGFGLALPALLLTGAALCWGLDNNLTAVIDGFTPEQSTLVKGLVAGAVNLGLGLALGGALPSVTVVLGALLIGALGYGASLVLYVRGAQLLGATRSQMIFSTAPLWGVGLAWGFLGEPILMSQLLAAGLLAAALWLTLREDHAHPHHHPAEVHTHWHTHGDGHHDHTHVGLPTWVWHSHEHGHEAVSHEHVHRPDLHHRHVHGG